MNLSDVVAEMKKLKPEEIRSQEAGFFEFVVHVELSSQLETVLERFFGAPLKPAGVAPSVEVNRSVAAYGGIRREQTLYYVEDEKTYCYAMIWPWQNRILLTVKIVQNPKKP